MTNPTRIEIVDLPTYIAANNCTCPWCEYVRQILAAKPGEIVQIPEGYTIEDSQQLLRIVSGYRTAFGGPTSTLPTDSQERKNTPIYSGVLAYFPRAIAYIAKVSKAGNDKHNPGQPLHWSKDKSNDHADCVGRHLIEHGTLDPDDNLLHSGKLAWRALALLETELEKAEQQQLVSHTGTVRKVA